MDFFERYLGFSDGHGDGRLEAIFMLALVIIITGIALAFFHKRYEQE